MKKFFLMAAALLTAGAAAGQNSTTIRPGAEKIEYSNMLFGQFIEHFDTQIYGGIFCPGNPLSDEDGFRTDVIAAMKELKVPIVRWPGGCFVSSYHWLDGVTNPRVPTYDKSWQVEDPNTFGTDEYVKWCRKVGCEPYICTNAGTGTAEEMSDWVEYCNQTMGKWARLRAQNGHPEPYNVKYWSIGNENYGTWELGAKTVDEWGPLVRESAKLMLAVDKSLMLFAAAQSNRNWTLPLLKAAGRYLNYVSIHGYWDSLQIVDNPKNYITSMMSTDGPERSIVNTIAILEEAGYGNGQIKIAFDEWNLRGWHHPYHGDLRRGFDLDARRNNDKATTYTMADALFSACFLNSCLRHSDIVEMACFSPIVNARGALYVYPEGLVKRSTFYTLYMYANDLMPYVVPTEEDLTQTLTQGNSSTKTLDVILTSDKDGKKFVYAIVNKDPEKEVSLTLDFKGMGKTAKSRVPAKILAGESVDDYNDIGDESVKPYQTTLPVKNGAVSLPAHSLTFITIE